MPIAERPVFLAPRVRPPLRVTLTAVAVAMLAACAGPGGEMMGAQPEQTRETISQLLPAQVKDRDGWARDIQVAFTAQDFAPTQDNLCAVIAVTEQESSFQISPAVPGLARIAREEIERRAAELHIPTFLVNAALGLNSSTGESYLDRLDLARTETQLSQIFDDFVDMVPLGRQLFGNFNPVRTGGPMQVSIAFAQAHAKDYPYPIEGSLREEVFSRRGGMYFGTRHLLGYEANYDAMLYRFADFNAGWYASRNAAFQQAISRLSGIDLALDGDLIIPGSRRAGATELAVRTLRRPLDLDDTAIRRDLEQSETLAFEKTALYERTFRLADRSAGKALPRAVLPRIALDSPKITRDLTTAWFAERVQERWQSCMKRGRV